MCKKIFSFLMCTALASGLVSCTEQGSPEQSDERISVVTTIFPQYDFVRQIAGDNVSLTMLLKPGSESHTYEPTPQDIVKIQECDLFIYNGGEGDMWVDTILESVKKPVNTIKLMECVDTVEEEIIEGMQHEHEEHAGTHEEPGPEADEHIWLSLRNARKCLCFTVRFSVLSARKLLDEVVGVHPKVKRNDETGYLQVQLPLQLEEAAKHDACLLIRSAENGLRSISEQYPDFVRVIIKNRR